MPTTIDAKLNDDIIVTSGMEAYKASLAALNLFSTDYSKEAVSKGAALQVPLIGSVGTSNIENDYETETGSMSAITVTMSGYAKSTVGLTDRQFLESSSASLQKFAAQMGNAVASAVITGVFANITKTNFPTALAPVAGMSVMDLLIMAREKFGSLKVPKTNRTYFPSASAYTALAKDSSVQVASAMAYGGTEYIRDGVIPRLLGFNLFESTILPSSSAAPNGFIVHPSALAVATRAVTPSEPKAYMESRTVTDADTGLTMSSRRHYDTGTGKHFMTFECIYGSAVGIKEGLILMPAIPSAS